AMEPHRMDAARLDSVTTSYERPFTDIQESANRQLNEKVLENTDRYASIMAIQSLDASRYAKTYKSLADGLRKKFPGHPAIRSFGDYVDRVLSTTAGQEAPDIRLASPDGKELALSDYRGKVVLVDFWASWC